MAENLPPSIKRHCRALTETETDELVGIVADLVVAHLRKNAGRAVSAPDQRADTATPTGRRPCDEAA